MLGLAALGLVWWRRHAARGGTLRAALREIDILEAAHARDRDDLRLADGASRLMRRVALRIEPQVSAQGGAAWRAFVQRHARDAATSEILDRLAVARFRARADLDAQSLLVALRAWCTHALSRSAARDCVQSATAPEEVAT
jgi:hypothetical protein